ncbi:MAG TPA: DUF3450 family protein, partial [bacterium]|nr:DUF3450 family protein [bacterium]
MFFLNEKNINAANDEVKIINEYLQNLKKIISNSPIDLVASKENEVLNEINFFDKNIFEKLWIYVQQDILDANNINVFVKEIKINNEYYEVEILKIGKISYLFRTSDDKLVGYLDYNDKSYIWKIAEPRVKKEILKAFKIYNKVAIPEMCMLFILVLKKIKILELSQLLQNFDNLIALK